MGKNVRWAHTMTKNHKLSGQADSLGAECEGPSSSNYEKKPLALKSSASGQRPRSFLPVMACPIPGHELIHVLDTLKRIRLTNLDRELEKSISWQTERVAIRTPLFALERTGLPLPGNTDSGSQNLTASTRRGARLVGFLTQLGARATLGLASDRSRLPTWAIC
jgi:hypothetical protein